MFLLTLVATALGLVLSAFAQSVSPMGCSMECEEHSHLAIVTRLWTLVEDANMTTQQVSDEFERGFAPQVVVLPGFRQYLGSPLLTDTELVFFFNVFETREEALTAQNMAAAFKADGVLNDQIEPVQFEEGVYSFLYTSNNCGGLGSQYLVTRLWRLTNDSTITQADVADEFESGYAPDVTSRAGFLAYGGVLLDSAELIFFYNVFTTQQGAAEANAGAADFVAGGILNGQIEKVQFEEGYIDFHFVCEQGGALAGAAWLALLLAALHALV